MTESKTSRVVNRAEQPVEKQVDPKTKKVVVLRRASYFGKSGLIKVEKGSASLPVNVADDFVKRGIARLHDAEAK